MKEKKRIKVKINFSLGFYINYRCSFYFTFWSSIVGFFFYPQQHLTNLSSKQAYKVAN